MKTIVLGLRNRIGINRLNALYSVADQCLVSGANFAVAFMLARLLGIEEFGIYILMFSVWLFINNLQIGFINQGLYVLSYSEGDRFRRNMFAIQLAFSSIVLVVVVLGALVVKPLLEYDSFTTVVAFAVAVAMMTIKEYVRNAGIAALELRNVLVYDAFFLSAMVALLLFQAALGTLSLRSVWFDFFLVSLIVVAMYAVVQDPKPNWNLSELAYTFMTNFRFTRWTTLTNIVVWANGNAYKFIVSAFMGLEFIAAVGAAQYVTYLLNPILNGLHNYCIAFLSKQKNGKAGAYQSAYRRYSFFLCSLVAILLLPILLFPTFYLSLFYGAKYIEYGFILRAFTAALSISIISRLIGLDIMVNRMSKIVFTIEFYSVVFSIIATVTAVFWFGVGGFLSALLGSGLFQLAVTIYLKPNTQIKPDLTFG